MLVIPFSVIWKWAVGFDEKNEATLPLISFARIMLSSVLCWSRSNITLLVTA